MATKPLISKVYSTPDVKTVYKQYDTRWSKLPYPDNNHTVGSSGCGNVSVTHCALENIKYRNLTPKDVRKFMVKYAKAGKGTTHEGIIAGLEKYGYTDTIQIKIKNRTDIAPFWNELKKGKKGVLLFRGVKKDKTNVTPDGTVWTELGHYIAVLGFKIVGNKHYLYTKDSGGKNHSGWWCYETSMKNSLYKVFLGYPPKDNVVLPERGYFKLGDTGKEVKNLQAWLNFYGFDCGSVDGVYGKKTSLGVTAFEEKYKLTVDGVWGKECQAQYEKLEK